MAKHSNKHLALAKHLGVHPDTIKETAYDTFEHESAEYLLLNSAEIEAGMKNDTDFMICRIK